MNKIMYILVLLFLLGAPGRSYQLRNLTYLCENMQSPDNVVVNIEKDEVIDLGDNCMVSSVVNLTIQGSEENRPTIRCTRRSEIQSVAFVFTNVTSLAIKNINFESCGGLLTEEDVDSYPDNALFNFTSGRAAIILCSFCTNVTIQNIAFTNNIGYAFAAVSLMGHSLLDNIVINGSSDPHLPYNSSLCKRPKTKYACGFRGLLLLFVDSDSATEENVLVQITNSVFDFNYNAPYDSSERENLKCVRSVFDEYFLGLYNYEIPDVGGLTIVYNQNNYNAGVEVVGSRFSNNRGSCFGAVLVMFFLEDLSYGSQVFQNCSFYNNSPLVTQEDFGWKYIGRDISLYMKLENKREDTDCVRILDSSFHSPGYFWQSDHSAISMTHFPGIHGTCRLYMKNVETNVSKRLLFATGLLQGQQFTIYLEDIRMIDHHTSHSYLKSGTDNYGLLTFSYIYNVILNGTSPDNCKFYNLIGPVIVVRASNLFLTGEMTFANNVGSKWGTGSAIMLQVDSGLWLQEPLHAHFCNNTAVTGGAIGSDQLAIEFCIIMFKPEDFTHDDDLPSMNVKVAFNNNSAELAGNSIFGQKLYTCTMRISPKIRVTDVKLLYNSTFQFTNPVDNGLLEMSGTPNEVCLCQGNASDFKDINCARDSLSVPRITTYPGQTFSVCVIVVDEIHNPVYSSVISSLLSANPSEEEVLSAWELGYGENIATVYGTACAKLNFTIYIKDNHTHYNDSNGTLAIYPYGQQRCIAIPVTLKTCPTGFSLINGSCDCDTIIRYHKCDINKETITKNKITEWMGIDLHGNFAYSPHCPLKYCSPNLTVDVYNFNYLCLYNRTNVSCGRCSKGLSSVFGQPYCWKCSNLWLLTLPLYVAAGILLVILLFVLRLTVTKGTINGVIFFANILNINTFFFLGATQTQWLYMFISWLNLELGFPICFYDGMTDLHSSYLSFIIPVYLWLIVIVMIYLSRKFQIISNLVAKSAVPVLATLIHLSFSRLLRFAIDGLIYIQLKVSHEKRSEQLVWYFDGNIQYLSREHAGMFVLALLSLALFIIPYTVFFTGIKFFLRFQTVSRFRPFVDAICGPYKDKYSYWFGARLCVLVVTYIVYSSFRDQAYLVILFQTIMLVIFALVQAVIMPYKSTLLNIIDLFYMADSIIIYMIGIYSEDQRVITTASNIVITPAVLLFLATVAYHVYAFILKGRCMTRKVIKDDSGSAESAEKVAIMGEKTSFSSSVQLPHSPLTTYSALNVDNQFNPKHYLPGELREPLIETDSDRD